MRPKSRDRVLAKPSPSPIRREEAKKSRADDGPKDNKPLKRQEEKRKEVKKGEEVRTVEIMRKADRKAEKTEEKRSVDLHVPNDAPRVKEKRKSKSRSRSAEQRSIPPYGPPRWAIAKKVSIDILSFAKMFLTVDLTA